VLSFIQDKYVDPKEPNAFGLRRRVSAVEKLDAKR
jgi:hypothetical protein